MNNNYNFDFSKSWEQLKEEAEKSTVSILPNGNYIGLITSACFSKNRVGYDIVQLKIKIVKPENYADVEITKNFTLDKNYVYASGQIKAFVLLLNGFGLSFNDLPSLANTLNALWVNGDKYVKIKAELRSIPNIPDQVTTYKLEAFIPNKIANQNQPIGQPQPTNQLTQVTQQPTSQPSAQQKSAVSQNEDLYDGLFDE